MITKTLLKSLQKQHNHILAAVSGGPDSLVLLHGLHSLGVNVSAAHYDHQIRPESASEAHFVKDFCRSLGVKCYLGRGNVPRAAREMGMSLEEAARSLRYQFLFQTAAELNVDGVATGHHADDQVETILMNLLRGAGPAGLSGMQPHWLPNPWSSEIPLIRPLLSIWKVDILEYAKQHDLNSLQDPSNRDQSFHRNRIRHQLLPLLEGYNPAVKAHLFRTGEVLREENRLLDELAGRQAKECLRRLAERAVSIDRGAFRGLPPALQRRLIRKAYIDLTPGEREISYDHVEQAVSFIVERKAAGTENWLGKLNLVSLPDEVLIADWQSEILIDRFPQLMRSGEQTILPPAEVPLGNEWSLRVELLRPGKLSDGRPLEKTAPYQAWLDGRTAAGGLTLRTRRPGDRIKPLGMGGKSIKVADLMINEKIPAQARKYWPLILSGEEIIWIPGLRISEQAKIVTDSSQVCRMKIYRKENWEGDDYSG